MRTRCNGLLVGLLLATAPLAALAADPPPAPAPPPPDINDPGQPASAPIRSDDPRLKPLPPESAQTPAPPPPADDAPVGPPKTDGDPTYAPRIPTDDAFHPPPKKPDTDVNAAADGLSVRTYTTSNGDKIEEYRNGGQLTKVRVVPVNGLPYELRKDEEKDRAGRTDARDKKIEPVHFTLFEWH